jgi:hypothetical protein
MGAGEAGRALEVALVVLGPFDGAEKPDLVCRIGMLDAQLRSSLEFGLHLVE